MYNKNKINMPRETKKTRKILLFVFANAFFYYEMNFLIRIILGECKGL